MSTIQPAGYAALRQAQTKLNSAAVNIAQGGPIPEDAVALLEARTQFTAGVKAIHVQDQICQSLLDLLP